MRVLILDDYSDIADAHYEFLLRIFNTLCIAYNKNDIYLCTLYRQVAELDDKRFDLAIIDWTLDDEHTGQEIVEMIECKNTLIIASACAVAADYADKNNLTYMSKPPQLDNIIAYIREKFVEK